MNDIFIFAFCVRKKQLIKQKYILKQLRYKLIENKTVVCFQNIHPISTKYVINIHVYDTLHVFVFFDRIAFLFFVNFSINLIQTQTVKSIFFVADRYTFVRKHIKTSKCSFPENSEFINMIQKYLFR